MSQAFTSSKLITSIKRRAMIPSSQSTFENEDFLEFADEEISLGLVPSILRLHEDYLLFTEEVTLEDDKSKYSIPARAIGNKLRDVAFKDESGNIHEMTRISIDDVSYYSGTHTTNRLYAFYVQNNQIVLVPNETGTRTGTLVFSYYLRPNSLVLEDNAAVVTNINRSTGVISVDKIPDGFSTTIKYDLIQSTSPFVTLNKDITVSSVNSTTKEITFTTTDIPDRLEVGDYINKQMETIVPQVPSDLHVVLAHRVASRCLEALGDTEGLANASRKLAEMEDKTTNIIDNRVEGAPQKIVNRHGPLRSGLQRKYRN